MTHTCKASLHRVFPQAFSVSCHGPHFVQWLPSGFLSFFSNCAQVRVAPQAEVSFRGSSRVPAPGTRRDEPLRTSVWEAKVRGTPLDKQNSYVWHQMKRYGFGPFLCEIVLIFTILFWIKVLCFDQGLELGSSSCIIFCFQNSSLGFK